ncbi:MAG TPA: NAD(P)-dependent oxidoreductase [Candidatus Limnocylindria bacterium]|nr:NAD(P)-dependent oxidoreductase [Candidatus Limnocylindria bacterium]
MNVAVTGPLGFIGRHVVAELEGRGLSPTLVCRPGAKIPGALSEHSVVRLDVINAPADAFRRLGSPETVIHLAWGGLPNYASSHHVEQELPAHRSFLGGLVAAGLGALTVTGTCLEYGLQTGALREDLPTAPVTAYGRAKDALRADLQALQSTHSFRLTWARLFYLHGEGQAAGSLVPQLEAAIGRGAMTFDMSGGEQLRDYLPVDVAARYLVSLATNDRDNGVVNVCSGKPIAVRDLAAAVAEKHRSSIRLNLGRYPYPDYEPMAFWGDRAKLDRQLAVAP